MIGGGIAHGVRRGGGFGGGLALLLAACQPPPTERRPTDPVAARRGLAAIERVQCAACHRIPGVRWPEGRTGPSLYGLGERSAIAGSLPNRPDVLAAFIRNAPSVKPGSPMPPMPISEQEARDIAFHLLQGGK